MICSLMLTGVFQLRDACSQELKIERQERTVPFFRDSEGASRGWVKVKGDLYRARFYLPPSFLWEFGYRADPFATNQPKEGSAQEALEKAGIKFGEGAKVTFFPKSSILMVTQTRGQMELVEAFLARHPPERQLSVRVEIYELPALQVLELVSSAEDEGNHKPERDAVFKLVKEGLARLVSMPTLTIRSGVKGAIIDGDVSVADKKITEKKNADQSSELVPEARHAGTFLEVEPVVAVDNWTMDLNIKLEHHTAPPELKPVANPKETPQFHSKIITTQVTIYSGNYLLIGTWRPSGKAEYKKKDLMHVVFLTANVQPFGGFGLKQTVGVDEERKKK